MGPLLLDVAATTRGEPEPGEQERLPPALSGRAQLLDLLREPRDVDRLLEPLGQEHHHAADGVLARHVAREHVHRERVLEPRACRARFAGEQREDAEAREGIGVTARVGGRVEDAECSVERRPCTIELRRGELGPPEAAERLATEVVSPGRTREVDGLADRRLGMRRVTALEVRTTGHETRADLGFALASGDCDLDGSLECRRAEVDREGEEHCV